MVAIDMNLTPPKVIGREVCLQTKSFFKLSKDFRFKRHPNTWRKEKSKEIKDFVKVKDKDVHHKGYDGHYMKQWVNIPKAT